MGWHMELGEKLRQARLEAGLSQRQLCGDEITRNMLSQIENGSAKPSMQTLQYLAAKLGKTVSFFLDEGIAVSSNQAVMEKARQLLQNDPKQALAVLEGYQSPDGVFDQEKQLLTVLCCLKAAALAIEEQRNVYAVTLLEKAARAGRDCLYYTKDLERQGLLLLYRAKPESARQLVDGLPDLLPELLLRGKAALESGDPNGCIQILNAASHRDAQWHFLCAEARLARGEYALAVEHYKAAEESFPAETARKLEQCYRQLEDYKMAYFYACKQRQE